MITGKMYKDIKQAYYGGHTDMFIPQGTDVKQYDVNLNNDFITFDIVLR